MILSREGGVATPDVAHAIMRVRARLLDQATEEPRHQRVAALVRVRARSPARVELRRAAGRAQV